MHTIKIASVALWFCLASCAVCVAQMRTEALVDLTIRNSTGKYIVTVSPGELEQALDITWEKSGRRVAIAHYSNLAFVYALPKYPKADHLITVWEAGTATTTVVFRLVPPSNQREIFFEDSSEIEPDFINSSSGGEFMLLYTGKHFLGKGSLWVPDTATVYQWDGAQCPISAPEDRPI